ncbi:Methyltransferase type 11 [Methanohalobium evestigatum Z-7303]|uniref:Methyltransferase type 11 n=1 Tax=Methanohalobium evestigatum (strain ATCC BAA-1072 / DSM 3721 / NBRC 107634 / OCM 161 / Z-7303) TaxID=644295 RepID=D7EBB1_METEZ|nr:class I SAM-dependent methyltransferase [Methanohalobium evestigatum]ADI74628.1 Methyltransferase type 11 [Methanohalobium evestigatum Z-7303]
MITENEKRNLKSQYLAWEQEYFHVKWGGSRSIEMVSSRISPGHKILDAGCGNGRHLLPLSKVYHVTGVDISPSALKNSKLHLEKNNCFAYQSVSTVTHLPFSDNIFDCVVSLGVLQHFYEHERELTIYEFSRVLASGGILVLEVFGVDDMRYGKGDNVGEENTFLRNGGIIYHYFTDKEIKSLLEKYKFQITDITNIKTEKRFNGDTYTRHHIRAVAQIF